MSVPTLEATTIVAVKWIRGVVIASDKQATMEGGKKELLRFVSKVCPLDDYSALGIAGAPAPALALARQLRVAIGALRNQYSREVSVAVKMDMMQKAVQQLLPAALQHQALFMCQFVMAFYDLSSGVPRIVEYNPSGFGLEKERFAVAGAGGDAAEGYLREQSPATGERTALRQALKALQRASECNATTSNPFEAADAIVLTQDGFHQLSQEEIQEVLR